MTPEEFAKLSAPDMIREAVKALDKCAADGGYIHDDLLWHGPAGSNTHISLPGAVMAAVFGAGRREKRVPRDYPDAADALRALSKFEWGYIDLAYRALSRDLPPINEWWDIPNYGSDPDAFKETMLRMAKELEEAEERL